MGRELSLGMPAWGGTGMNRRGRIKGIFHRHFKGGDLSKEKRERYSYFSCGCYQIPNQKQLKGENS